jgi:hypothetical protein
MEKFFTLFVIIDFYKEESEYFKFDQPIETDILAGLKLETITFGKIKVNNIEYQLNYYTRELLAFGTINTRPDKINWTIITSKEFFIKKDQ